MKEEIWIEIDMEKLEESDMIDLFKLLKTNNPHIIQKVLEEKTKEILKGNNIINKNMIYEYFLTKNAVKLKGNSIKKINNTDTSEENYDPKEELTKQKLFTFNTIKHKKVDDFFENTDKGLHSHYIRKAIEYYVDNIT